MGDGDYRDVLSLATMHEDVSKVHSITEYSINGDADHDSDALIDISVLCTILLFPVDNDIMIISILIVMLSILYFAILCGVVCVKLKVIRFSL